MNIVIRVNASRFTGTGHFYRSLNLAKSLKNNKIKIFFVCDNLNKIFIKKLRSEKMNYYILKKKNIEKNYQQKDIFQTLSVLKKIGKSIDLLIVDSYKIGKRWEDKIRSHVKRIMVIDDLFRNHSCDIFLNQNLSANFKIKKLLPKNCKVLIGPKYCLLNQNYKNKRVNKIKSYIKNVLIFMGGSDTANLTTKILQILSSKKFLHLNLNFVVGINNIKYLLIKKLAKLRPQTKIYHNLPNLINVINKSDIVISSGGTAIWEFIFFGVPSLVINQANNQIYNSKYLHKVGAIKLFGRNTINLIPLKNFLKENLLKKNFRIPYKITKLFDGKGTLRVKKIINDNLR